MPLAPPLRAGHVREEAHAFGRGMLYRLGYSNALRRQLEYSLGHWEKEGQALAFLLPPVVDVEGFDVAHVQERYDIPLEMRPLVASYIAFFQGAGRKWFVRWLGRSTRYVPLMRPILEKAQLPRDTVYLAMIESGFSPHAYSWAHAAGPWQFIPSTGAYYGLKQDFWVDERRDPVKSTQAAARYLAELYRKLGNWYLAWASYNAGETRVRRLMERHQSMDFWELSELGNLAKETQHYVPKLIAAALIAKHPEAFGFEREEIAYQPPLEFDEVLLDSATDLNLIAKLVGSSLETLQEFNPELLHLYTPPPPPQQPYVLRIPKGTKEPFTEAYAQLSDQEKRNAKPYAIRKGDTLKKLAAHAKLHMDVLAHFNNLNPQATLYVGQVLFLPNVGLLNNPLQASGPARLQKRPVVYRVVSGDSLWSISRKFGVDLQKLQTWNRSLLRKHKTLQPGANLTLWPTSPAKTHKPQQVHSSSSAKNSANLQQKKPPMTKSM
ncbi:MAG: transglycosylase SLT domain-containing protein [Cystobacterineae bacterium]|nr:transglycosylase SLT domain-containing protein [Cystobacterineae bacterium]